MFSNDKNKKIFNINTNSNLNSHRIIKHKSINNSIEKKINKNSEINNNNNYLKEIKKLQCEISLIKNELLNEKTKYEILYHKYNNLKSSIKITNLNVNLNKQKKFFDSKNNNNNNIFNRNKSNSNFNCDSLNNNNNNNSIYNNTINNNFNGFNLFSVTKDFHSLIGNLLDVLEIFILDDIENTSEDNNYENNSIKIQIIEEIKNNLIKKLKQIQVNNFEWLDGLENEIKRIKKWNVNINNNNNSNKSYKKNNKSIDNLKQFSILNNNNSVKNFYKLNNFIYPQTRKNNYRKIINNVSLYSNKNINNNINYNKNLNDDYDFTISNEKDNYTYNNKSFNYNIKNSNNNSFKNNNSLDNIKIKKQKIIYEKNNNFNYYDY